MKSSPVTLLMAVVVMVALPQSGRAQEATIEIFQPWEEAVYVAPASISFRISVFVPDTFLESVDVLANGTAIGSAFYCPEHVDCTAPNLRLRNNYEFFFDEAQSEGPWSDMLAGRYELVARGVDPRNGQVFESEPVSISVWSKTPSVLWIDLLGVEHDQIFQTDELIPLEFLAVLPEDHLSSAHVFANGRRIGDGADCAPNAFCGGAPQGQRSTRLTFYQDGGAIDDWGYWKGARPGAHEITVKGYNESIGEVESESFSIIVTDAPIREVPDFVLPVANAIYHPGDRIPIDVRLRVPPEGLDHIFITANGERIGYVDYCPPNADCGGPGVGEVVHLEFYHDQVQDLDDWSYWTNALPGPHELAIMIQDPDTGVARLGETLTITVQDPNTLPPLTLTRDGDGSVTLQLAPFAGASVYSLESSSNLIEWKSLGQVTNGYSEVLDPSEAAIQFFRLRK